MAAAAATAAAAVAVADAAPEAPAAAADDEDLPEQPSLPTPPPAPALPFRPRVLTVGRQGQQQQPPSSLPRPGGRKRPALSTPTAAAPAAPVEVNGKAKAPSTLWRRHEHGSYQHYYFRRKPGKGGAGATDARLAVLKGEWFRGKALLDIGTNTGKVAWEIYQRFGAARVLGVDIDAELIATARAKLGHACRRDGVDHGRAVAFECRDIVGGGGGDGDGGGQDEADGIDKQYDVVTCLSVTKHVHLQGGDAALLRLFRRAHALLRPGGRFVLEPQPWRTYRKRKHASADSARHYAALHLRPPFMDVLLGPEVSFAAVEDLGVPPDAAEGYQRPLYCFVKAAAGDAGSMEGDGAGVDGET